MRKKFIPLSLALCLTLSGCGGNVVLERSYSVSTPHSEVYWENEGADTLRADSYQDLVNALLLLLGEHSEEGVVRIYSEEDAAAMAEQACKEVQEETALGAYLLDYISYTDTQERAYYEMHVRLGYRRTAEEQAGIVTATSTEALPDLLRLTARKRVLREEEHADTVFSLSADIHAQSLCDSCKKFVGDLGQNTDTVTGLAFRILTGSVLQILYDLQCILHGRAALLSVNIDTGSDTAVIMLKFFPI